MEMNWIPFEIEDGCLVGNLPEEDERILICTKDGYVCIDEFLCDVDGFYLESGWAFFEDVIAWMPLPEPYKEEKRMHEQGLSELFAPIVDNTLLALCAKADEFNYDRDSFIQAFASMFKTMSEVSTFERYRKDEKNG